RHGSGQLTEVSLRRARRRARRNLSYACAERKKDVRRSPGVNGKPSVSRSSLASAAADVLSAPVDQSRHVVTGAYDSTSRTSPENARLEYSWRVPGAISVGVEQLNDV